MTATLPFIQDSFDRFNALCFEGVLPPIPIVLTKARTFLGKVEYRGVRGLFGLVTANKDFLMKISTSFDLPREELEDVVLHEMIHYYIAWKGIKDSSVHGKAFRNIMQQLNATYGRHISIRHKTVEGQLPAKDTGTSRHYVCVTTFRDGVRCVTVAASTRIAELHRFFSHCPDIVKTQWFRSTDPFFDRYPHSRTPKVYRIAPNDLETHLRNAVAFDCPIHS